MAEFSVLMLIPDRGKEHKMVSFLDGSEDIAGLLKFSEKDSTNSKFLYEIVDSDDVFIVQLVRTCEIAHEALLEPWKKYKCIVFDVEDHCFTKIFFEQKKDSISKKIPIVKLVSEMAICNNESEELEFSMPTILLHEERNIIEINRSEQINIIFGIIIRLVRKPKITFVIPDSIKLDIKIEKFTKIFRNIPAGNITILTNNDANEVMNDGFKYPNRMNFFIYVVDTEDFNKINHLFQILNSNKSYYLLVLYGARQGGSLNFFLQKRLELENYLNVIKNYTAMPKELKNGLSQRCDDLLEKKDYIIDFFRNEGNEYYFTKNYDFEKKIISNITKKMFESCQYVGVVFGLTGHNAEKRILKIIEDKKVKIFSLTKMEKQKVTTHIITQNFHAPVENAASRDINQYTTINNSDYRQQLASFVKKVEKSGLTEAQQETLNKLEHLLNDKTKDSESLLSKISSKIQTVVEFSNDSVSLIDQLLEHKSTIMDVIGSLIP